MRIAEDEITDLGLNEDKCQKIESAIAQFIESKFKKETKRQKLHIFWALQLVRQQIADELGIPYN